MTTAHDEINLVKGQPNPGLLPVELVKDAAMAVLSDPSVARNGMLYGPDPGYQPLREELASWLSGFYKPDHQVVPERFCITGGASQNLGCILSVYTEPAYTRNIWIVVPAYHLIFKIFEDAGFAQKMRAVPEDEEGINVAYLREQIQKSEDDARENGNTKPAYKYDRAHAKVYKHVIYCVPTFSNPSSRTMSLRRRRDLVRLAREFDALIVTDDVYDFLQWPANVKSATDRQGLVVDMDNAHFPRLADVDATYDGGTERAGADGFGNSCSNGSFSKLVGPGLRVGWVEGTKKFIYGVSQCGTQRSGGAPSQLTSTYFAHMLREGQVQGLIKSILRPAYASRYATLMRAITKHLLPLGFTLPQVDRNVIGGYFIWLGLPAGLHALDYMEKCLQEDHVRIAHGGLFEVPGDNARFNFPSSIRLCFAWVDEERDLAAGIVKIARRAQMMLDMEYVHVQA